MHLKKLYAFKKNVSTVEQNVSRNSDNADQSLKGRVNGYCFGPMCLKLTHRSYKM